MNNYLLKIVAHVHVPDCENQLNYIVKETMLVKATTLEEAEKKIKEHITIEHHRPPLHDIMDMSVSNLTLETLE